MEIREFVWNGKKLADPGPGMSPEDVKGLYAATDAELITAGVKELPKGPGGETRYEFTKNVGRKG